MVYEAIDVQCIINSIGLCLYFFNSEILVPLEVFKKFILPHFERFSDCTCKFEIHSCYLKILNIFIWFSDQLEMGL